MIFYVGVASIYASFDTFCVVLVSQNGNAKGSFLLFSVVKEYYNSYKARGAIKLFQLDESF